MKKDFKCTFCGKPNISARARKRHNKNCEKNYTRGQEDLNGPPRLDPETFEDLYGHLSDGAFFAMAFEHGLEPEDFIYD